MSAVLPLVILYLLSKKRHVFEYPIEQRIHRAFVKIVKGAERTVFSFMLKKFPLKEKTFVKAI